MQRLMSLFLKVGLVCLSVIPGLASAESFDETEIRVIRNKYFEKSLRLELSGGLSTIMNQSFLYTYLGGINLGFHLTEQWGILGEAYFGQNVRKDDCDTLGVVFSIDPLVQEVGSYFMGSLDYTPIYGKFQLSTGRVIYFDWFLEAGGGVASIRSGGLRCAVGTTENIQDESVSTYALALHASSGQRIFVNQRMSVNWRVRFMRSERVFGAVGEDGSVTADTTSLVDGESFVLVNIGVSYFL